MTDGYSREGQNGDEVLDHPAVRKKGPDGEDDHDDDEEEGKGDGPFESAEDFGDFDEEVCCERMG